MDSFVMEELMRSKSGRKELNEVRVYKDMSHLPTKGMDKGQIAVTQEGNIYVWDGIQWKTQMVGDVSELAARLENVENFLNGKKFLLADDQ